MMVNIGDLVGFYRRKTPGMGIVLETIDDILEHCGVDRDIAFSIAENAQGRTYWEKKSAIEELCGARPKSPTALRLFFQYNERWCRKPYDSRVTENEGWYPADWVRSK